MSEALPARARTNFTEMAATFSEFTAIPLRNHSSAFKKSGLGGTAGAIGSPRPSPRPGLAYERDLEPNEEVQEYVCNETEKDVSHAKGK
jgi:hypothetical protein